MRRLVTSTAQLVLMPTASAAGPSRASTSTTWRSCIPGGWPTFDDTRQLRRRACRRAFALVAVCRPGLLDQLQRIIMRLLPQRHPQQPAGDHERSVDGNASSAMERPTPLSAPCQGCSTPCYIEKLAANRLRRTRADERRGLMSVRRRRSLRRPWRRQRAGRLSSEEARRPSLQTAAWSSEVGRSDPKPEGPCAGRCPVARMGAYVEWARSWLAR
jgi:hypothetical protein